MDEENEAKEILLRAAEIQANQGQTLETGEKHYLRNTKML